ncbi:putative major facilitator superfamily transporter [Rhizodiscina lignyota]|uniref:Major facilitator superfamily transporter n=1 Tax=Rhizodiscina lignyota TaxID=1504668 RepID=A0A9P4IK03_9PEZI|nr:putative major facilitator superfamily transporter [Rhizodiscina lignyota]
MEVSKSTSEQIEGAPPVGNIDTTFELEDEQKLSNLEDDPHRAALEDNPPEPEKMTFMKTLAIFFLGLAISAPVGCGFLLVTPVLDNIGEAVGNTSLGWIPSGWSTASGVSFCIAGAFSDIFGRKYVIVAGQVFTIVGAIVAGTATTVHSVIAGSTIIGFGAGFVFVTYAAIPEIVPNKYRGAALSWAELCINLPWGVCQTIISVQLAEKATWRWVYYICIIVAGVTMAGTIITYFPPSRPQRDYEKSRLQELFELDWIGMILYTSGLTVFLIGFSWAGTPGYPWKSVSVILPIVLGAVIFILCFVYDWTLAKNPFFPFSLFSKVREFSLLLVGLFVAGMIFFSMASILPQASTYVFGSDGIQLGLTQLPNNFGQLIGGAIIPAFMHKIKHMREQLVVALAIQTIFTAAYAATIPQHKAAWMALQLFGSICFSWATLCCYVAAGVNVPLRELGLATGIIGTFRNSGGSVGIAIFNTIRTGVLNSQLAPRVTKAALENGFPSSSLKELVPAVQEAVLGKPAALRALSGVTPAVESATITAFKGAYAYAFQRVFLSTIPFGVIATVTVIFVKESSQYLTNHTAVHLEREQLRESKKRESGAA